MKFRRLLHVFGVNPISGNVGYLANHAVKLQIQDGSRKTELHVYRRL